VANKNGIKFACYVYQQGLKYKDILRIVLECERSGFDSVWLKDNFTSSWFNAYFSNKKEGDDKQQEPDLEEPILECWTTLSSLAGLQLIIVPLLLLSFFYLFGYNNCYSTCNSINSSDTF
jgi:hypothetical protein